MEFIAFAIGVGRAGSVARPETRYKEVWMERERKTGERSESDRSTARTSSRRTRTVSEPTDDDVERWADDERRRRQAWLEGPTEREKLEWAAVQRRRREARSRTQDPAVSGPTDDEVEAWADEERRRRQAWLEGPTELEKLEYAHRERRRVGARGGHHLDDRFLEDLEFDATAWNLHRELELARHGGMKLLADWPVWAWWRLRRAGRAWEAGFFDVPPRRRIPLYEPFEDF
jgi:hypothetical protein